MGRGVAKDPAEGFAWVKKAAEHGRPDGEYHVGRCLQDGTGVAKDVAEGFAWIRKSAERGYSYGECELGRCLRDGIGVARDVTEGFAWIKKSAEAGNSDGEFELGQCLHDGNDVAQDFVAAASWLTKSERHGCKKAGAALSGLLAKHPGVALAIEPPILQAARRGEHDTVLDQIRQGANAWCVSRDRRTSVILLACLEGWDDVVKEMLKQVQV
jgi:TPR repeat protein